MKRGNINYYLDLPWDIKVKKIREEEGGGWYAAIPLLGEWRCIGDGETREEALANLDKTLKDMIEDYLERGVEIPEPEEEEELKYNGKILLRTTRQMHGMLMAAAKENGMGLNSYINHLLTSKLTLELVNRNIGDMAGSVSESMECLRSISANYATREWKEKRSSPAKAQMRSIKQFGDRLPGLNYEPQKH